MEVYVDIAVLQVHLLREAFSDLPVPASSLALMVLTGYFSQCPYQCVLMSSIPMALQPAPQGGDGVKVLLLLCLGSVLVNSSCSDKSLLS